MTKEPGRGAERDAVAAEWEPLPDYGDLMTMDKFIESCKKGWFIDYDGFGEYATETQTSRITVSPSDAKSGALREGFSHVVWFNR